MTPIVVWPEDVRALLIPDAAAHVIVTRRRADDVPPALVPRQVVVEALGDRAPAFAEPVPYRLYRGGAAHPAILAAILAAGGEPARAFRSVKPDEIVDA